MPVYQRRDGATIKLGYLVKRTNGDQTAFAVKQILTRKDLATVTLTLVPYQILMKTGAPIEKRCRVEDVSCVRGRHMEAVVEMASAEAVAAGRWRWWRRQWRRWRGAPVVRGSVP